MPEDWGSQRLEGLPAPFEGLPKVSSYPRRLRAFLRHCVSIGDQGLVIGHQPASMEHLQRYLELSGAQIQAKAVKTAKKNSDGWKKGHAIGWMVRLSAAATLVAAEIASAIVLDKNTGTTAVAGLLIVDGVQHSRAAATAQAFIKESMEQPIEDFNEGLARELGLRSGQDVDTSAFTVVPPALEKLDFSDLGPSEDFREFEADYRISRRDGLWYVGESVVSPGQLSSWLSDMGYDKAALALIQGKVNASLHAVAEVNARIPVHLAIRARAANPSVFPVKPQDTSFPAHGIKDGQVSPREIEDK